MRAIVWAGLAGALSLASPALAADKVTFGTNWLAEAEHGGYYQAVVDGTYAKFGLDVTILLLDGGVFLAASQFEAAFVSLAHSEDDIALTLAAISESL